jgi:hypothetical protein
MTRASEAVMSDKQPSWIEEMCKLLAPVERETLEKFGEEKGGFFITVANDWLAINTALLAAYPVEREHNLVVFTFWSLFKEVRWFHFLFVAGNYPLLFSRMRFAWESMFRAYFAERYPLGPCQRWDPPGQSPDDKLAWLEKHGGDLRWDTCVEPVLRTVFPLAEREEEVREYYKALYKHLHRYAHPSAYLTGRMTAELHALDAFDEDLALETIDIGAKVFELIWLAVFAHHAEAFERVEPLSAKYPVLRSVFEDVRGSG